MRPLVCSFLCMACVACTELPNVPGASSGAGGAQDYPLLVPLNSVALITNDNDLTEQNVGARVTNLRARAARLKKVQFN